MASNLRIIGKINIKKIIIASIILSVNFIFSHYAYANIVKVISYPSSCDYFIANDNSNYYLFKWRGGYKPSEGDIIFGDLNSNGPKDIYYLLKDRESRAYVEDYSMSEYRAFEHYNEHCN